MNRYQITVDVRTKEELDKTAMEVLRTAISAIIDDNVDNVTIGGVRFTNVLMAGANGVAFPA